MLSLFKLLAVIHNVSFELKQILFYLSFKNEEENVPEQNLGFNSSNSFSSKPIAHNQLCVHVYFLDVLCVKPAQPLAGLDGGVYSTATA